MWWRRVGVVIAALVASGAAVLAAVVDPAPARLDRATPPDGTVLSAPPGEIVLAFKWAGPIRSASRCWAWVG